MEGLTKFQKLWRAKRVFTNNQGAWKLSSSKITTQVVTFKVDVDFGAFFQNTPKKKIANTPGLIKPVYS
jgi:hypothetical protein